MTPTDPLRPRRWHGTTWIGDGWAQYEGEAGDSTPHAHLAHQLVCGRDGSVQLWVDGVGEVHAPAVFVASGRSHRLAPGPVAILFVEATSTVGRQFTHACTTGYVLLNEAKAAAVRDQWPEAGASLESLAGLASVLGALPDARRVRRPATQRVRQLIEALPHRTPVPTSIDSLAAETSLSVAHFRRHLSTAVGLPCGAYLRWLRLRRALTLAARGATLTQAAHDSGFADASHLTRTMHAHFGVAPSDVLASLRAPR